MVVKKSLLIAPLILFFSVNSYAQLTEDFESGDSKGSYAEATVSLSTGNWKLNEALIGTTESDLKNDQRSVRMRSNGVLEMDFDYEEGVEQLRFYLANSGFANDTDGEIQVQYSSDSGNSWTDVNETIIAPDILEVQTIDVIIDGPIRFRWVHANGGRINIDDITIKPYFIPDDDPTILVNRENDRITHDSDLSFLPTNIQSTKTIDLNISNTGKPDLVITNVYLTDGTDFSINSDINGSYETLEESIFSVSFNPQSGGAKSDQIRIESNDPKTPQFSINLIGYAISEDEIIPISTARNLEFGTRAKVAGRVIVSEEFEGPVFIQDESAGIAVFYEPIHNAVQRGDSVHITGPITEFNPTGQGEGTFLIQIAEFEGDNDIQFDIIDTEQIEVTPEPITILGMNSGDYESQLVRLQNVEIHHTGTYQGNTNYEIEDITDTGVLRIDGSTAIVGAGAADAQTDIIGVIDRFDGIYQIKPRDLDDLNAEPFVYPGEDITRGETFDVATWNIEWFGDASRGPDDLDLQLNNVIEVIKTVDADIFTFQEIASREQFANLANRLDEYRGFTSSYLQSQQTAFLFKKSVIDSLDSGEFVPDGVDEDYWNYNWAGRPPLFFRFNATVGGKRVEIHSYGIHAKAFGDEPSYQRRLNAALQLKDYFDENLSSDNVLLFGDFNDQLRLSTFDEVESPYNSFVTDENYLPITITLEDRGQVSYVVGRFRSMIDHVIVTNDLMESHISGAERVENVSYINNYTSTTSDHVPVWTRFNFSDTDVGEEPPMAPVSENFELAPNYPNPFNTTTNIKFTIPEDDEITIDIYDITGRKVAALLQIQEFSAGVNIIPFDASGLASGMYIYRVRLSGGHSLIDTMMLIK